MKKLLSLTILLLLLLSGCASVPSVQPKATCPVIPPLIQTPAAQVPGFTSRMESFLSGKVPEPTSYSLTSPSAKVNTKLPFAQ